MTLEIKLQMVFRSPLEKLDALNIWQIIVSLNVYDGTSQHVWPVVKEWFNADAYVGH